MVIIGGGFSGKLAAIALSKYFSDIIILEKKCLKDNYVQVPQHNHCHFLLKSGLNELDKIIPNVREKLNLQGSLEYDVKHKFIWYHYGGKKINYISNMNIIQQHRDVLENMLHKELKLYDHITYLENCIVRNISKNNNEIKIDVLLNKNEESFQCDYLVYSTGNINLLSKQLGLSINKKENNINLTYYSKKITLPKIYLDKLCGFAISPQFPNNLFGITVQKINQQGECIATLGHYGEEIQPLDIINLLKNRYKDDIPTDILNCLNNYDWEKYVIKNTSFLNIKKENNIPENVFILGNSLCLLDPIFGQGFSLATLQVAKMIEIFENNHSPSSVDYYRKVIPIVKKVWNMSSCEHSFLTNSADLSDKISHYFIKKMSILSTKDKPSYDYLVNTMHLLNINDKHIPYPILLKLLRPLEKGDDHIYE